MSPVRTRSPAQFVPKKSINKTKLNKDFFKKVKILDGGMGQELLSRGLKQVGTLWSASAILNEKYHKLVLETHLDYIDAGCDVIVTNTFSTRKQKLIENNLGHKFEELNAKAAELSLIAKEKNPHILVAGGLPPQNMVYVEDKRSDEEIMENFYDQAKIISPFVDFFILEVLSSSREVKLSVEAIKSLKKPYLIGLHVSEGKKLPSGEKISTIINDLRINKSLGVILSCVSPENYSLNSKELKDLDCPYGFKLNGFDFTNPASGYSNTYNKGSVNNPNEILGKRKDLDPQKFSEFTKKFNQLGATILGGCCETSPAHIKEIAKFRDQNLYLKKPM